MGAVAFPVRSEAQGLDDPADPSGADQLAGLDGAAHLEALGEGDRPEPARLRDRLLDLVELIEGDAAGLVGDDVLAVAQRLDRDGGPAVGHGGGDDQVNGRIAEQGLRVVAHSHVGPAFANRPRDRRGRVVGAEPDELAALAQQPVDLPEDMCVVQADGGEPYRPIILILRGHHLVSPHFSSPADARDSDCAEGSPAP